MKLGGQNNYCILGSLDKIEEIREHNKLTKKTRSVSVQLDNSVRITVVLLNGNGTP